MRWKSITFFLFALVTLAHAQSDSERLLNTWLQNQNDATSRNFRYSFTEEANRKVTMRAGERNFDITTNYRVDLSVPEFIFDLTRVAIDGREVDRPSRSQLRRGAIEPVSRLLAEMPSYLSPAFISRMQSTGGVARDTLRNSVLANRVRLFPVDTPHPIENMLLWFSIEDNRLLAARIAFKPIPPPRGAPTVGNDTRPVRPPVLFARFQRIRGLDLPVESRLWATVRSQIRGRIAHFRIVQNSKFVDFRFDEAP